MKEVGGEGGGGEVGRRGRFWGQRRGLKNPWAGEEDEFLVHPQNGLNGLILTWCIGGCWFTPARSNQLPLFYGLLYGQI